MLNDTTQLDAIQNEAAKSSIAPEEVNATAADTKLESNAETTKKETSSQEDVQASVKAILDKARGNEASPEGTETPEDEPDSPDPSTETDDKADEKETSGDEEADANEAKDKEALGDEAEANANETADEKRVREARELIAKVDAEKNIPDEKLPFHKHPRFQQLVTENRTLKESTAEFTAIDKYRKDNGIDTETFNQALTLAALSRKEPAKFVEALKQIVDNQEIALGVKLPSDLAKKVEDGELSEAMAKEMSQLRMEKQRNEQGNKTATQRAEQQRVADVTRALNVMGMDLQKKDPSFKPKTNGGPDGVWEFALKSFTLLQASSPAKNGMEAAQQFTNCYNEVKSLIESYTPRTRASRNFVASAQRNSRASGLTPSSRKGEPATATDAVNDVLKKHGIKIRTPSESNGEN